MSIVGPRPQLIRDMVFMTDEQRKRHDVRPGLSGLAQVNGRNDIDWEDKLNWDLKYIQKITFLGDIKIILQTVLKAFVKQEGITEGDMATAEDFGDYLLHSGKVSQEEYDQKQEEPELGIGLHQSAIEFLKMFGIKENQIVMVSEPTRVETLIIPEMSYVPLSHWHKEYLEIIHKVVGNVQKPTDYMPEKVYFSRSKFSSQLKSDFGEEISNSLYICNESAQA